MLGLVDARDVCSCGDAAECYDELGHRMPSNAQVFSLLALLVQKYKYPHLKYPLGPLGHRITCNAQVAVQQALSLLALLVQLISILISDCLL
jgi:hypothetical protein